MNKRFLILLSTCIAAFNLSLSAQETANSVVKIKGQIYLDKNGNNKQDKNEKGLKQILVSNGVDIVSTQKDGSFEIVSKVGQSIFPILPTGYEIDKKGNNIGNVNFVYLDKDSISKFSNERIIFGLKQVNQKKSFKIGAIGDVQVDNDEELDYAARSIFKELANRNDLAFNLLLGDQVNDKMDMMPKFKKALNLIETTSWTMVGNHDRNTKNQQLMNDVFNRNFGADTYSFNYADIHFIVLNNVFSTGKHGYEGRLSDEQLLFLKNNLSHVPKNKTIVISQHIPMAFTKNRKDAFKILDEYQNVLILTGHTHQVRRHLYSNSNIQELGVGATCGNWWTGEKDFDGIPHAIMQCGTPRGYFTVDFDNSKYSIKYKAVGLDPNKQMTLSTDSNMLVANIYAGSDSTAVFVKYENTDWVKMEKSRRIDPFVENLIAKNKSKIYPTDGNKRNPIGRKESSHIWECILPKSENSGIKKVSIKAVDKYGLNLIEEQFIVY